MTAWTQCETRLRRILGLRLAETVASTELCFCRHTENVTAWLRLDQETTAAMMTTNTREEEGKRRVETAWLTADQGWRGDWRRAARVLMTRSQAPDMMRLHTRLSFTLQGNSHSVNQLSDCSATLELILLLSSLTTKTDQTDYIGMGLF